ncbi:MAG: hypothetical protein IJX92_05210 [Clostridia bacterium]|nr:hypothetical protein [Clostridia bacterium]
MEFLEVVIEIFLEIYMELMLLIVPEGHLTKWQTRLAKLVATIAVFGIVLLFIWGIGLVAYGGEPLGFIPIAIATALSLVQIIAGIVLYNKNHKD